MHEQEKSYFRFLKNLPRKFRSLFFLGFVLYAAGMIIDILMPLAQQTFIDSSINTGRIALKALVALGAIYVGSVVFQKLQSACFRNLRMKVVNHYYREAIWRLWSIPRAIIAQKGLGYYGNILISGCQNLGILIAPQIFSFFFLSIQALAGLTVAYSWYRPIGILFTILMAISAANTFLFRSGRNRQMDLYRQASDDLARKNDDYISNTMTYKIFGDFRSASAALYEGIGNVTGTFGKFLKGLENNRLISGMTEALGLFLTLVLGMGAVVRGDLSYGQLVALAAYCSVILRPFEAFVTFLGDLAQYGTYVTRYEAAFGYFNTAYRNSTLKQPVKGKSEMEVSDASIGFSSASSYLHEAPTFVEFHGVRVDYQDDATSFDFSIEGPSALIGLSGEGKTTVARLLFKEKVPAAGKILINGCTDLADLVESSWVGSLAVLGQEEEIFNSDLAYNLLMGKKLIPASELPLQQAKLESDLRRFVDGDCIPMTEEAFVLAWHYSLIGLETRCAFSVKKQFQEYAYSNPARIVSKWLSMLFIEKERYESVTEQLDIAKLADRTFGQTGVGISGGEKQRIALARFLLKDDFDFFILDEPFTAMDAILEAQCTQLLMRKIEGRPGLLITHKIHLAETLADRIIVIKDGQVEATGSPKELIEASVHYRNLRKAYFANVLKSSQ